MSNMKSLCLVSMALALVLWGLTGATPANADIYPNLSPELCMADAYGGNLNCTANDVEITKVIPIDAEGDRATLPDGSPNPDYDSVECVAGQTFSLHADITVRTNASERYDNTFYLPLTENSPMDLQGGQTNCSIVLPIPHDEPDQIADVDLDSDLCGDITKAYGPDEYTLSDETVTMYCQSSATDPTRAEFTYCAAWDNQERSNCDLDNPPGQVPGTKSKCNCDSFPIDVFIKPPAPVITKTLESSGTRPELGGQYTFSLSFTNPSATASIFISALTDEVDREGDGSYDISLNLWDPPTTPPTIDSSTPDWVYLISSNCPIPPTGSELYEVAPSGTYSCQFTVHIKDGDLPDLPGTDPSKEHYKDVILAELKDKNGDPVVDDDTCPANLEAGPGQHCSNEVTVDVTNVSPTIAVTKTADPDQVVEGTHDITYTVSIQNTSTVDAVTITSIQDAVDAADPIDLVGQTGGCEVGTILAGGDSCTFTYLESVTGNTGDVISNTVIVKAVDNENDEASNSDNATVTFSNSPGAIQLTKTAATDPPTEPPAVTESGDDVTFTLLIKNTSAIDSITLTKLDDDQFGVIFDSSGYQGDCNFYGDILAPAETRQCTITKFLSGEPGAENNHINTATVYGNTGDLIPCDTGLCLEEVMDADDATLAFINEPADILLSVDMSLTFFVTITNSSSYESVNLNALRIGGQNVADGEGTAGFVIRNSGGSFSGGFNGSSYPACVEDLSTTPKVIDPDGVYECAFTVELIENGGGIANIFNCSGDVNLEVSVSDQDGLSNVEKSVSVKAQLVPNL